ncbi:MAG: hypothetical protein JWM27_2043 [Gemmatimonadetes bacterium]|nr:hypothetical protein [Gemmatimonadota bacterium]
MKIIHFLERSGATDSFRESVTAFVRTGRANEHVVFDYRSPAVKVERALTKALEEYPDLPLESIELDASSGCEFYRGVMTLRGGGEERRVRFQWDCKWRAEQEGWRDYFGFADQTRAAREFGHDCFMRWEEEPVLERAG